MFYVLFMTSPSAIDLDTFERVLRATVSVPFMEQLCRTRKVKTRAGIYSLAVVVWLMIYQRLNSKRTLSSAVQFLAREAEHWQHRRLAGSTAGPISTRTGGYCRARLKFPKLVAIDVCDHILEQLQVLMRERLPDVRRPVFVMDGTTLRLPHRPELVRAFPPGSNQHGDNHWPTMLLVAFHDVHTGLGLRLDRTILFVPEFGTRLFSCEPPVDLHFLSVHSAVPSFRLALERIQRRNPSPSQALACEETDFDLRLIEPAAVSRSVVHREPVPDLAAEVFAVQLRPRTSDDGYSDYP